MRCCGWSARGKGHTAIEFARLRLILPQGKSSALAYRLAAIDPRLTVQIFELDPLREVLQRINPINEGM
jgi:hypothetical protein